MQVSKSQVRAAKLLGVTVDPINDEYQELVERLEDAGVSGDGLPAGMNWRQAGKLSDEELVTKLVTDAAAFAAYSQSRVDLASN